MIVTDELPLGGCDGAPSLGSEPWGRSVRANGKVRVVSNPKVAGRCWILAAPTVVAHYCRSGTNPGGGLRITREARAEAENAVMRRGIVRAAFDDKRARRATTDCRRLAVEWLITNKREPKVRISGCPFLGEVVVAVKGGGGMRRGTQHCCHKYFRRKIFLPKQPASLVMSRGITVSP